MISFFFDEQSHGNSSEESKANSKKLFDMLGWFLFDFLLLGYAEDPQSGLSFRMQSGITWNIYIEVNHIILYM